jgi:cell division transport system permease protein
LLTVAMMALVLLLPLALALLVANLSRLERSLEWPRGLSAFLDVGTAAQSANQLAASWRREPDVAEVTVRNPEQGRKELARLPGFAPALALLDDNPLPFVLSVMPVPGSDSEALARRLQAGAGVAFVAQDAALGERFRAIAALLERGAQLAAGVFALAALLTVGNTIRLDVAARAEEILVMQTVGAEPAFIRRPFLYAGIWYGLGSALLALLALAALEFAMRAPVAMLASSYGSEFRPVGIDPLLALAALAAGIVLGWLGARIAVARMLRRGRLDR